MKMRFLQRSVALLLFICMMFSVMPVEFMQVAFAETYGGGVVNFGGSGNNNKYGGVWKANQVGFRVALNREEKNYLNGTEERRNALLEYYSSRWPTGYDLNQNTIYLFAQGAVDWMSGSNNVPSANRGLVATYTPGHSDPDFYNGKYKKSIIPYSTGNSAPTKNTFKEYALSQYGNQVSGLAAFGDNVWMAHMPTYSEAIAVLGYIFQQSGSQYEIDKKIQYYVDLGNTPDPKTGRTAKFQDDPSTLTAKQKFEISAGYAGLLMCFYSVIAADVDREGVASYFEEAINDYLGNKNIEQKPVTLVIDTAIAMVHTNMPDDANGISNDENKTYVISTIDMIQYAGLTKETEALTTAGNRILTYNPNAKYSTKELIKAMHEISVIELPASETFAGKGPGTPIRFLDSTKIGRYQSGVGRHPVNWGASAYYFNAGMGGRIRNKQLNGNGVQWGDYAGEWPGYLGYLKLDTAKEIYGFMFVGQHIENPVPDVSYYVDPKVMMGNDVCTDTVKTTDASNITVYIKGDSSLISAMNSRKDDPNFAGIKINATVYRTDYLNGMADENLHNPKQEMGELAAQLTTTLTGDDMIAKLQGAPFLLKDMTLYEKDYDKIEGSSQSYFYVYDIYLDITIDGETYYFGSKGTENHKDTDTQEIKDKRTEIVQKSSNGSKVNFAEVSVSALSKDIPLPEDTVITKPASPDITEIVNPSEQEKLEEQNQMIKRFGYSTEGTQFAEIKSNYPLQEEYEVMGGIPSSEEIYFSVGGMEYKVALVTQYWMNEHSRDRTYTVHFDGNTCEFNNNEKGKGDTFANMNVPVPEGASSSELNVSCTDNELSASWTVTFTTKCKATSNGCHDVSIDCVGYDMTAFNKAKEQANAWITLLGNPETSTIEWTAASEAFSSRESDKKGLRKGFATLDSTTGPNTWVAPSVTHQSGSCKGCTCSGDEPCGDCHGIAKSPVLCKEQTITYTVKLTIPPHQVCGPCCGHVMPELWDTWRQGLVFDFVKISQMRLYKLDQGSVDGLQELTGTDTVFANVVSGQPTYFMNIAQFTEKNKYGQKILPSVFDTTTPAEDNISHITLNKENLMDTFITYLGSGTRDTSQSSRAGRLRYVLAHDHQENDTITFAEQGNGAASTTWTIDYKKIAAPEQHDDVIYEAGPRSKNCDGMATTNNFGKKSSDNVKPMEFTGHVNEWADGCLYTNSLEKTVQEGILVEPTPDGTGVYMSASTEAYSGYWDPSVYGNGKWEENTLKTYDENDEHILKYKEDYNHHVVREDKLASVAENKDGTLLKKAYNDAADSRDTQSPEWQFFDKARRTKIIANVISDFLILQTSGGDQSIFYYEKESEPTEAQEHFQKVKMTAQELYLHNPLSVFTGDTTCDMTAGAMVKSNVSEKFIIVGGYNGQYNEVDDKYRPYNLQDSKFKKFYDEGWAVYNTNTHEGNATDEGSENGYNRLGNTEIITIFDKGYSTAHGKTDGDPAGTIVRPERQATSQETSFKILQDNLQILPTAENKLYTPYNAKTYYSQVLGYYTIDRGVLDAYDRSTVVGPWGNVKIGWGQQVEHGEYYKEFWGQANGVDYPTKYYQVPIKDNVSGDIISNETDSGSTTVNQIVVYTPVSTEDAIVMELEDLKFKSSDGSTVTASRDQRVNNFQYPNMNDLVNALKVCPLDPELCEYRYLDCKYHDDSVLAEFDFEPQYVEKEIRRVKKDKEDGTYEVVQEIIEKDTKVNTYKNDAGNWVVTNKVTGVEYILPSDFTIESNSKVGTNRYLSAKGTRWAIPFSSLGLSTSKSNRVSVQMDLTVDSTSEDLMLVSFYNYGFIINPNKVLGSFVGRSSLDNSKFGPRMDAVSNTNLNKVRIELIFGFNNVVDCEAYILVGDTRIPTDVTVSDLKKIWKDEEINGVKTGVRKLVTEQVTIDDWINDAPETFTTEDIGTNLIIGSWGSADNYTANYYIDNLRVTLKGGTEGHNSTCYERLTVHATNRIHVHDSDCYLDEDMYTCTGELNANYKCNGAFNEHVHTDDCYTNITNNSVNVPENESLTKEYIAKKDGTITIAGYGSCSSETWQATLTVNGTQIWNYNDDVAGNKTYNFKKDDIIEFYVYSYNSCDVGWNVSWTSGAFGEWTGNCTGALNTHVHTGVAGKDFPNGCYTEPSVHKHNHTPNVLVCGQTEMDGAADLTPMDFDYKGVVQNKTLAPGKYKLQVWGARGGEGQNDTDYGYGGYSEGIITLKSTTNVYVYVGGEGTYGGEGGFNGGGSATSSGNNCGSGGGGTDIRIGEDSLYARVIVAGGGGGSGDDDSGTRGHGGGESGVKSTGTAGTQTSGYEFGVGQDGASGDYAGGGGGWYGAYDGTSEDPASGGSGYVYTASTAGNYPSGCKLNSSHYLSEAKTVAGSSEFVSPSGSTEIGHDDAGYARITPLGGHTHTADCYAEYITESFNNVVCGIPTSGGGVEYTFGTGGNTYNPTSGYGSTSIKLPAGRYKFEVWGAQGVSYSSTYYGGKGGYSAGEKTFTKDTTVYVYVGGQGVTFNGGHATYGNYHYGSGGASHIATASGELSSLSKGSILLVAGGGGGATKNGVGGYGGGANQNGGAGEGGYSNRMPGLGGTLSAGGAAGTGNNGNAGSFGLGGRNTAGSSSGGSMGGGGLYGGGSGSNDYSSHNDNDDGSGGGGSGYADSSLSSVSYTNGSREGNGFVKITSLSHTHTTNCYDKFDIPEGYMAYAKCGKDETGGTNFNETYSYESANYKTVTLDAGTYEVELYGAEGGYCNKDTSVKGSKGTYVRGTLELNSRTTVYLYIGGQGVPGNSKAGGFNGGGKSGGCSCGSGSGGGGTDIRIGGTDPSNRVMVAGGGGGAGTPSYAGYTTSKSNGTLVNGSTGNSSDGGGGGGGYHGGAAGSSVDIGGYIGTSYVNNTEYTTDVSTDDYEVKHNNNSGNGKIVIKSTGHTHISDCYELVKINRCEFLPKDSLVCTGELNTTTDYNTHLHSVDCLTMQADIDPKMLRYTGGMQTYVVPWTDEYTIETYGTELNGRTGYAKTTVNLKAGQVLYVYVGGVQGYNNYATDVRFIMKPAKASAGEEPIEDLLTIKSEESRFISAGQTDNADITFIRSVEQCEVANGSTGMRGGDGNGRVLITCANTKVTKTIYQQIIDGEMSHADAKKYLGEYVYNKVMEGKENLLHTWEDWTYNNTKGFTEVQNAKLLYGGSSLICGKTENDPGTPIEIKYSGKIETVNLPAGEYKLEVWGAQGGGHSYPNSTNTSYGGYGGYSSGTINLNSPTTLYVAVGGSGGYTELGNYTSYHNGYNGGGNVTLTPNGNDGSAGGGGATHIAKRAGLLSSLNSYRSDVLIVAGGGGGTEHVGVSSASVQGGSGGGTTGGIAVSEVGNSNAATQSSGYAFGLGQSVNGTHMGSGGGGWYGGYCGTTSNTIGNGGSGYIGGVQNGVTENGKRGNNNIVGLDGLARITPLSHTHTNECYGGGVGGYNCGLSAGSEEVVGEFDYNDATQDITLSAGTYRLEVWGAEGGSASTYAGGKGGYSVGELTLSSSTKLFVYTGGKGTSNIIGATNVAGGFNGGGVINGESSNWTVGSGGGGTDIRIGTDSPYARVIVAGGGGAATYGSHGYGGSGGHGGGTTGVRVATYTSSDYQPGYGGTQNAGGASYISKSGNTYVSDGSFGQGGGVYTLKITGGGGGGWFGGGSGYCSGGGGGSGFVYTSATAQYTNSSYTGGTWLLNSNYYLTSADTIAGDQTFTAPDGTSETGHSGNGYARITRLGHTHTADCGYSSGGVGGGGTATTLTCDIPVGGDGQVRTYGTGGNTYNPTNGYGSTSTTLPAGRYRLEVWGAQGGAGDGDKGANTATVLGGKGGYSVGELTLNKSTIVYVKVGGMGTAVAGNLTGTGGFNGGGNVVLGSSGNSSSIRRGTGGGASDIRINNDSLYARVIVAGGGGGTAGTATTRTNDNTGNNTKFGTVGGVGGGESGVNGEDCISNTTNDTRIGGGGGSQTVGGTAGLYRGDKGTATAGSFGQGGQSGNVSSNSYMGAAGGGGWYGGGGGAGGGAGGGGGSGFVYTSATAQYTNSSYTGGTWLLNSNYYLTSASTTAGNQTFKSPTGTNETGHSGNGFVKITSLDHQHTADCYTTVPIPDGYVLNCDKTKDHVHSMDAGCFIEFVGEDGLTVISSGNPAQFEVPLGNIPAEAISKIVVYAKNCPNNVGKIYLKDATNSYNEDDSITSDTIVPNTENQVMTFILRDNPNLSGELTSLMFELANVKGQFNISKIEVYGYGYKVDGTGDNNGSGVATEVYDFTYKGYTQTKQLTAGTYKLETWGATGASGRSGSNWRVEGGYSSGIVNLKSTTTLYINVGGAATNGGVSGGWNGGGNDNDTSAGGGGGATDISLRGTANSTSWNTTDHLNSRIIVAGGSGGGHEPSYGRGGYGGGTTGGNAFNEGSNSGSYNTFRGLGGSQNAGGDGATANATCTDGGFGYGGQGQDGGGGGSGWYGGGGGYGGIGGGGGSGYVLTSTSSKPTGYTPTSDYYMTSPVILSGNDSNRPANPAGTLTNGYARITALNTFTPLEITYRDPFDGSENIILQKDENGDYLYLNKIPDKINGEYNPIWVCKFKEFNAHICESENSLGEMVKICLTHVVFNCVEPHHRGEHYAGSNKICWSACGEDENHVNTKTEVQIGEETVRLANFLQLDAGFTVYFPNRGDFRGNDAHGLSQPQITRGMGYKNNMDTTQWTREKRIKFPFEVIFDDKENGEMAIHQPNTWIELDVETEYFNFYIPVANQELSNAEVEFEVEAINCGTNAGVKVKRSIRKGGYIEYSDSVSTAYLKELNDFRTEYITVLLRSIQAGYSIPYPSATGGNTAEFTDFEKFAYWRLFTDKAQTIEKPLIDAVEAIDRQIERDFEGTKSNTDKVAPKDSVDLIWPHNKSGNGINDELKKITNNDNKNYIDNKLRSNSLESLHGGYKSFYLDVIGRIGNFAITDTDDFRFSNFFKVSIDRLPYANAFDETDPDNWLVEGLVLKVDEGVQNYYIGDTYDLRGNKASKETRWLDTYKTEKWMTGEMVVGTNDEGALVIDRDITKPNLRSQILTGDVNNIDVLRDEELRFGYDTYTSVVTAGSYTGGYVQVIPKYYALKLTDKAGSDSYDKPIGTYVPLDVYINKDGLYTAVNIFGNAENGEPNKGGLKLHDFAFNLDWTTEAERRNYTIEEKERTLKIKEILTILDYGVSEEDARDWETIMNDNKNQEPSLIELVIPRGRNNYIGTPQYMLMDGKHRTFIGSSESHGGNEYERKGLETEWPIDKNIGKAIYPVRFEQNVQRWHGKLGVPSSSVFVPSGMQVNSDTIKYVMNDEWAIICTAEIIAIGDTWSIAYSQPWFKTLTINGTDYRTSPTGQHYPGHRVYDGNDSVQCEDCIPPIIAVYSSDSSSVDDIEIVQTH